MSASKHNPILNVMERIQKIKANRVEHKRVYHLTRELFNIAKNPDENAAEKIKDLVKKGADVNKFDMRRERSLLHYAAEQNRMDIVKALIECGCKTYINVNDINGKDPAFYAIDNNNPEMLDYLLSNGVSTARPADMNYISSFRYAVRSGHIDLVEIELNHGADINDHAGESWVDYGKYARFYSGSTPLHDLTYGRDISGGVGPEKRVYDKKMIIYLLSKGARTDIASDYGTKLDYLWEVPEIKEGLKEMSAKDSNVATLLKAKGRDY